MYEDEVLKRISDIIDKNNGATDIELCMILIDDSDEISLCKQKSLNRSDFIVWKEIALPLYAFYINQNILPKNRTGMEIYAGVKRTFVSEYLSPH